VAGSQLSFGEDSLGCDIPFLIPAVAITRLNMETKRGKEKRNQAACCVEPYGWCVVASIGLKRHFGYDRAVLLIQATTVRISNGPKPLSLHVRKVKWT
jgi:hypothetical protein